MSLEEELQPGEGEDMADPGTTNTQEMEEILGHPNIPHSGDWKKMVEAAKKCCNEDGQEYE